MSSFGLLYILAESGYFILRTVLLEPSYMQSTRQTLVTAPFPSLLRGQAGQDASEANADDINIFIIKQ